MRTIKAMYEKLGKLIQEQRVARGWDQAALAARMGAEVRQQAISGWERGVSRPRRNMLPTLAAVLDLEEGLLVNLAGYETQNDTPIAPLIKHLPLGQLSPDDFEIFVCDLLRIVHPNCKVSRQGSRGHRQHGIDTVIERDGVIDVGVQVKQVLQFGPADVKDAIAAVSIPCAKKLLCLSRVASPQARSEIRKHGDWDLWDLDDISRIVRQLPRADAVPLVDLHFPGLRQKFLGVSEPSPWLKTSEYFLPAKDAIFSHEWALVGRTAELDALKKFADGDKQVGLLVGRGGIGKTKLLKEMATEAEARGIAVRFLVNNSSVTPSHYELLPETGELLLVIEDAHERSDIADIVTRARHLPNNVKTLFSTRPYGLEVLKQALSRVAIHIQDTDVVNVSDLTIDDAENLVKQTLDRGDSPVVSQLAALGRDCPLLCVVGGNLLKRGMLNLPHVQNDKKLREDILIRFKDAFAAGNENVADVLQAISLIQPVRVKDEAFKDALAFLCGKPYAKLLPTFRILEERGIILNRGGSLRIVPDLLGDVVLRQAAFDEYSDGSSGFVERSWQHLGGPALEHAFINTCRLDWTSDDRTRSDPLTEALWKKLATELDQVSIQQKQTLLKLIGRVAIYAPDQALAVVEQMLAHPTPASEQTVWGHTLTYKDVEYAAAPVLQRIAYHLKHFRECVDLLWALGKTDDRALNPNWEHPIRILQELCGYDIDKPVAYTEAMVTAAESWFENWQPGDLYSPFDVIEAVFSTEGHHDRSEGHTLVLRPFAISPNAVSSLRKRVTDIALQEANHSNLKRSIRAISALGAGLQFPVGLIGRPVSKEEREHWTPLLVEVLKALLDFVGKSHADPLVNIQIRSILNWHAAHGPTETKDLADQILDALPTGLEHDLAIGLFDGWGHIELRRADIHADYEAHRIEWQRRLRDLVLAHYETNELTLAIERRLNLQAGVMRREATPGPFTGCLVEANPQLGESIVKRVLERPDSPLAEIVPVVLAVLMELSPSETLGVIQELLKLDVIGITRCVAQALGWNRRAREVSLAELDVLLALAGHADPHVRTHIVTAAQRLAPVNEPAATQLLLRVPFHDSSALAEHVISSFIHREFPWDSASPALQEHIWNELERCPQIGQWEFAEFAQQVSVHDCERVVHLLMKRIEHSESYSRSEFEAIPYERFSLNPPVVVRKKLLREIIDWLAQPHEGWKRTHHGAELFKSLAHGFDQEVIGVLDEMLLSSNKEVISAACSVLKEAPPNFVWEQPDFVSRVLRTAESHGKKVLDAAKSALFSSAISGIRMTSGGQPFPQDIEQRDRSHEMAARFAPGTPERELYEGLEQSAIAHLKMHEVENERIADNREW